MHQAINASLLPAFESLRAQFVEEVRASFGAQSALETGPSQLRDHCHVLVETLVQSIGLSLHQPSPRGSARACVQCDKTTGALQV